MQRRHPDDPATLALFEQVSDAEKASFLVHARRLVMAATVPSFVQGRSVRRKPLPGVALAPVTDGENDEDEKAHRKLRTTLAFLTGLEGADMPRDVFRVMLDLLMPTWDLLRHKGAWPGGGQPRSK